VTGAGPERGVGSHLSGKVSEPFHRVRHAKEAGEVGGVGVVGSIESDSGNIDQIVIGLELGDEIAVNLDWFSESGGSERLFGCVRVRSPSSRGSKNIDVDLTGEVGITICGVGVASGSLEREVCVADSCARVVNEVDDIVITCEGLGRDCLAASGVGVVSTKSDLSGEVDHQEMMEMKKIRDEWDHLIINFIAGETFS